MFVIASVPSPTSFTYAMLNAPSADADSSPKPTFGALWQVGRVVVENNVIELVVSILPTVDPPTAVRLDRKPSTPTAPASPYIFGQVIVRGNVIRHVDNASDPTGVPLAISLNSCEGALVEENVIKLDRTHPMEFTACSAVYFFNNQTVSGALIQGYNTVAGQFVNELTTDADLSLILAT
jgi:hypothetical protein